MHNHSLRRKACGCMLSFFSYHSFFFVYFFVYFSTSLQWTFISFIICIVYAIHTCLQFVLCLVADCAIVALNCGNDHTNRWIEQMLQSNLKNVLREQWSKTDEAKIYQEHWFCNWLPEFMVEHRQFLFYVISFGV